MIKETPNKRNLLPLKAMKRCGPLSLEAGVAHRKWQHGGGCLVRAGTTKGLWELEPWQRQSPCLGWGKTS